MSKTQNLTKSTQRSCSHWATLWRCESFSFLKVDPWTDDPVDVLHWKKISLQPLTGTDWGTGCGEPSPAGQVHGRGEAEEGAVWALSGGLHMSGIPVIEAQQLYLSQAFMCTERWNVSIVTIDCAKSINNTPLEERGSKKNVKLH